MTSKPFIAALAASLLLCGCQQIESWTGGTSGNPPSPALNADDSRPITDAKQRAYTAPIGQQITWNNPATGHSGTITAVKDGYSQQGAYCREFQETIMAQDQPKTTSSSACQQPDGSWKPGPL